MANDGLTAAGERVIRELDKLNELIVKVGFQQGEASEDDGTDICDVAAWNELGTINIPSRPFMRDTVENNENEISDFMQKEVLDIVKNGKTAEQAFKEIGIKVKDLMQQTITEGNFTPNAPSTIRKKGSSKPLIDSGRMRQSVNYVIKEK